MNILSEEFLNWMRELHVNLVGIGVKYNQTSGHREELIVHMSGRIACATYGSEETDNAAHLEAFFELVADDEARKGFFDTGDCIAINIECREHTDLDIRTSYLDDQIYYISIGMEDGTVRRGVLGLGQMKEIADLLQKNEAEMAAIHRHNMGS